MDGKMANIKRGFTLVEIMMVVVIIAILAAIAIPNLLRARVAANDAMAQSTLKAIGTAFENYMTVHGKYPDDTDTLLGDTPPYLNKDYFIGTHAGFTYSTTLGMYDYTVEADPVIEHQTGTTAFTLTTGGVIQGGS